MMMMISMRKEYQTGINFLQNIFHSIDRISIKTLLLSMLLIIIVVKKLYFQHSRLSQLYQLFRDVLCIVQKLKVECGNFIFEITLSRKQEFRVNIKLSACTFCASTLQKIYVLYFFQYYVMYTCEQAEPSHYQICAVRLTFFIVLI